MRKGISNVYDTFFAIGDTCPSIPTGNDAANMLKAELKRKGVTYAQFVEMISDKEVNVRNKFSRGKFTAAFFFNAFRPLGYRICAWADCWH